MGDPSQSDDERGALPDVVLRIGLLGAAVIAWQGGVFMWDAGNTPVDRVSLGLMLVSNALAFVLLLVAFWRPVSRRAAWLIPLVCLVVFVDHGQGHAETEQVVGVLFTTDVQLYMDQAARLIRDGANPYAVDLRDAFRVHRAPMNYSTPLADGDFTGRMPYPALAPLLFLVFQLAGLPTTWVFPLTFVGCAAVLWWAADETWRPLVLLPFFAARHYLAFAYGGVSDTLWALLLLLMIVAWQRRGTRGALFGLACAVKHQPWLLAPFLLVRVWHETPGTPRERLAATARFAGWSVASFALVNLPFAAWAPRRWVTGILEPAFADMVALGQGWAALTVTGVSVLPEWVYSVTMLAVLVTLLVAYARHFHRFPDAVWVFPALVLWFGHRSLTSYWLYAAFPLMLALTLDRSRFGGSVPEAPRRAAWPDAALGATVLAVLALVTGIAAGRGTPLQVVVLDPVWVHGQHVWKVEVFVRNDTDGPIAPRFRVQSNVDQPYFWDVQTGPDVVGPGRGASFTIATDVPHEWAEARRGAVITVSDAHNQGIQGAATLPQMVEWAYPDAVPNGRFRLWSSDTGVPAFWGLIAEPGGGGVVPLQSADGRARVALTLRPAAPGERHTVRLDTYLFLPEDPIEVEVYVPAEANQLPDLDLAYGINLVAGDNQVWVLFGDEAGHGTLGARHHWWMVPTQREAWVVQRIHPREIFEALGVVLDERLVRIPRFMHLEVPAVPAHVQLLLSVDGPFGEVEAPFGEVRNTALRPDPQHMFDRGRDQPAMVELWLGDHNLRMRNGATARAHYEAAIGMDPELADAWTGLGAALALQGEYAAAVGAYEQAIQLNRGAARAYRGIGWAWLEQGDALEALRSFDLAITAAGAHIDHNPVDDAEAHLGRARALARLRRCEEALDAAATFTAINPDHLVPAGLGCEPASAP